MYLTEIMTLSKFFLAPAPQQSDQEGQDYFWTPYTPWEFRCELETQAGNMDRVTRTRVQSRNLLGEQGKISEQIHSIRASNTCGISEPDFPSLS